MTIEKTKPVQRIRYGAISVAIWENFGDNGNFHNVTVERTYSDASNQVKSASSFGLKDIGLLQMALADAARWIAEQKGSESISEAA